VLNRLLKMGHVKRLRPRPPNHEYVVILGIGYHGHHSIRRVGEKLLVMLFPSLLRMLSELFQRRTGMLVEETFHVLLGKSGRCDAAGLVGAEDNRRQVGAVRIAACRPAQAAPSRTRGRLTVLSLRSFSTEGSPSPGRRTCCW